MTLSLRGGVTVESSSKRRLPLEVLDFTEWMDFGQAFDSAVKERFGTCSLSMEGTKPYEP